MCASPLIKHAMLLGQDKRELVSTRPCTQTQHAHAAHTQLYLPSVSAICSIKTSKLSVQCTRSHAYKLVPLLYVCVCVSIQGMVIFPDLDAMEETLRSQREAKDSAQPSASRAGQAAPTHSTQQGPTASSSHPLVQAASQAELQALVFSEVTKLNAARYAQHTGRHAQHVHVQHSTSQEHTV